MCNKTYLSYLSNRRENTDGAKETNDATVITLPSNKTDKWIEQENGDDAKTIDKLNVKK